MKMLLASVDELLFKCKLCNESKIERGNFENHCRNCSKQIVRYSNAGIGCPWSGQIDKLDKHTKQRINLQDILYSSEEEDDHSYYTNMLEIHARQRQPMIAENVVPSHKCICSEKRSYFCVNIMKQQNFFVLH
jgi:hypothetical protein